MGLRYLINCIVRAGGILVFCLLMPAASVAAVDAFAQSGAGEIAAGSEYSESDARVGISRETAIQIAVDKLGIPSTAELSGDSFVSEQNYDGMPPKSYWQFFWYQYGTDMTNVNWNVGVSADSGEILSMYKHQSSQSGSGYRGLPPYTREQAELTAESFARKLYPQRFAETRLYPVNDNLPAISMQEREPVEYNFIYARYIGDVLCPSGFMFVTVNGDTGEVCRFETEWADHLSLSAPADWITKEQAENIFRTQSPLELQYFYPDLYNGSEAAVQLVYTLPGLSQGVVIDAVSGEVLDNKIGLYYRNRLQDFALLNAWSYPETARTENMENTGRNLLSQAEALEIAGSAVSIPADYVLESAAIEHDYLYGGNETWIFSWSKASQSAYSADIIRVGVDAVNGDVKSFLRSDYSISNVSEVTEAHISEEDARAIAVDCVKRVQPDKWSQTELVPQVLMDNELYYYFTFAREANGIKSMVEGISVMIYSATGEVGAYSMTWREDAVFSVPDAVISQDAAADKYLLEAPLELGCLHYGETSQSMQVAYFTPHLYFAVLDAVTGDCLDLAGRPVTPPQHRKVFSDLAGHPSQEAVELLAYYNMVSGNGNSFRPDDPITQAELTALLVQVHGWSPQHNNDRQNWYLPYYEQAPNYDIMPSGETPEPEQAVNREDFARLVVPCLDKYNIAGYSEIYNLDLPDADQITQELKGYAAMALALDLLQPQAGGFAPQAQVTRGEAVEAIVKLLQANSNSGM